MTDSKKFYSDLRNRVANVELRARDLQSSQPDATTEETDSRRRKISATFDIAAAAFGLAGMVATALFDGHVALLFAGAASLMSIATYLAPPTRRTDPVCMSIFSCAANFTKGVLFLLPVFFVGRTSAALLYPASFASFGRATVDATETAKLSSGRGDTPSQILRRATRLGAALDIAIGCAGTDRMLDTYEERQAFQKRVRDLEDELDYC